MRRIAMFVMLALVAVVWGVNTVAQSNPTNEELLQAFDKARFLEAASFTFTVEVVADRPDGTQQASVRLFFKGIDGKRYSRIEFLAPADMVGQVFVNTPDGSFFWTPDLTDGPLKVSSSLQVFGDASVAETAGIQFEGDYTITARRDVTLSDGTAAVEADLQATAKSVAFPSATITAEGKTLKPLKVRLFAKSGDPLNDVTYEEYADLNGDSYVKKQLIENQLITANKTLLTITEIEAKDLSDDLFDPTKLGK